MRPIEPGDKQLLQAFRDNSSADAGYRRFFARAGRSPPVSCAISPRSITATMRRSSP
jgi:hypothetical protein